MKPTQAQIKAVAKVIHEKKYVYDDIPLAKAVLTAAAEMGDKHDGELCLSTEQARWHLTQIEKVKAATIERCAQVAEEVDDGECGYQHAKHIAAAIRAIGDQGNVR